MPRIRSILLLLGAVVATAAVVLAFLYRMHAAREQRQAAVEAVLAALERGAYRTARRRAEQLLNKLEPGQVRDALQATAALTVLLERSSSLCARPDGLRQVLDAIDRAARQWQACTGPQSAHAVSTIRAIAWKRLTRAMDQAVHQVAEHPTERSVNELRATLRLPEVIRNVPRDTRDRWMAALQRAAAVVADTSRARQVQAAAARLRQAVGTGNLAAAVREAVEAVNGYPGRATEIADALRALQRSCRIDRRRASRPEPPAPAEVRIPVQHLVGSPDRSAAPRVVAFRLGRFLIRWDAGRWELTGIELPGKPSGGGQRQSQDECRWDGPNVEAADGQTVYRLTLPELVLAADHDQGTLAAVGESGLVYLFRRRSGEKLVPAAILLPVTPKPTLGATVRVTPTVTAVCRRLLGGDSTVEIYLGEANAVQATAAARVTAEHLTSACVFAAGTVYVAGTRGRVYGYRWTDASRNLRPAGAIPICSVPEPKVEHVPLLRRGWGETLIATCHDRLTLLVPKPLAMRLEQRWTVTLPREPGTHVAAVYPAGRTGILVVRKTTRGEYAYVELFSLRDGALLRRSRIGLPVDAAVPLPHGWLVACARTGRIWTWDGHESVRELLREPTAEGSQVLFDPRARWIVLAGPHHLLAIDGEGSSCSLRFSGVAKSWNSTLLYCAAEWFTGDGGSESTPCAFFLDGNSQPGVVPLVPPNTPIAGAPLDLDGTGPPIAAAPSAHGIWATRRGARQVLLLRFEASRDRLSVARTVDLGEPVLSLHRVDSDRAVAVTQSGSVLEIPGDPTRTQPVRLTQCKPPVRAVASMGAIWIVDGNGMVRAVGNRSAGARPRPVPGQRVRWLLLPPSFESTVSLAWQRADRYWCAGRVEELPDGAWYVLPDRPVAIANRPAQGWEALLPGCVALDLHLSPGPAQTSAPDPTQSR